MAHLRGQEGRPGGNITQQKVNCNGQPGNVLLETLENKQPVRFLIMKNLFSLKFNVFQLIIHKVKVNILIISMTAF